MEVESVEDIVPQDALSRLTLAVDDKVQDLLPWLEPYWQLVLFLLLFALVSAVGLVLYQVCRPTLKAPTRYLGQFHDKTH